MSVSMEARRYAAALILSCVTDDADLGADVLLAAEEEIETADLIMALALHAAGILDATAHAVGSDPERLARRLVDVMARE